ncbi:hypothetical protein RHMOL_Rhmol04G0009700 [Rhododendron molle]|uniref:Uncharacterized protein n=1 Tax=Rhododendron molle TaxID=49168 RepID=A0ACC0NY40_RHOML|nr:hypothetical protein RHMOL_Rhmol04G0009700 [Rhododendron molle]
MPQESNYSSVFSPPSKNLRGLKGLNSLVNNNNNNNNNGNGISDASSYAEEIINDRELAQRRAGEAASRRYQAAEWLRQMDHCASDLLSKRPSEEDFCRSLRNGLILCNVLNKVNPGAVHKVVENPIIDVQATEAAAQSAIQYFENMRNFLVAVGNMKLLTFEASDLEKHCPFLNLANLVLQGGSSNKVVDCILCLKGYYEWKQAGGIGVWRYGGTVRITSLPKESPSSLIGSDSTDESVDESEASQYEQLLDFLHLSSEVSDEESKAANALTFLFEAFGLRMLQAYLIESNGTEDFPLNAMVIDTVLRKVVKDFSAQLVSEGIQLGLLLKKLLQSNGVALSKSEFLEAISKYLAQRTSLVSSDLSKFCICGGRREVWQSIGDSADNADINDLQHKQLEELKLRFQEAKQEVEQVREGWQEERTRLGEETYRRSLPVFIPGYTESEVIVQCLLKVSVKLLCKLTLFIFSEHQIKDLEVASSSYHEVLEENRLLYNQVQDLKGTIRVYCRVRPFLPGQGDGQSTVDYIGENGNIMIVNPCKQGKDARRVFNFNKVFATNVTQEQIYADTQPLIRSVLDGYNCCIFAYGQTGSGKTYTMYLLLYTLTTCTLDIRNNSQLNGLNVPDASLVPVKCTEDVLDLMKIGQRNRAVGATALNERSSRSHSILTVHVRGKELVSGSILKGCLHLVDLAGSERVDKSEAVGERLKEAQHINRSLSALGDVIAALAQKSTHIPYRNSKLTQVLQDSLGGHAKTLMFVHINPEVNAIGETISTLKFAERVASIDLGAARSNKETGEIRDLKEEISNLKLSLERKEAELEQLKNANTRGTVESQRTRAVSPLLIPKYGVSASLKPEISQRPVDDSRNFEVRSSSSGKQRRSRVPSKFLDKDIIPRMPFLAEERLVNSGKPRSPSPPVRRSISTDRGALMKSRVKPDPTDHTPISKLQLPPRSSVNKSMATMSVIPPVDNNGRGLLGSQEVPKPDNISEAFLSFQRSIAKKVHLENEDGQFKQVLNVRQGGIRKSKPESKVKAKNQLPTRIPKSDTSLTLLSELDTGGKMEEARKSDFSEPENESGLNVSPVNSTLSVKKLQRNSARNSQTVEIRELGQKVESFLSLKSEQKVSNGVLRQPKEGSNSAMPEIRRSRSTPRGKFMILP